MHCFYFLMFGGFQQPIRLPSVFLPHHFKIGLSGVLGSEIQSKGYCNNPHIGLPEKCDRLATEDHRIAMRLQSACSEIGQLACQRTTLNACSKEI
jgi:hypothetical protein